jgi:hypothetical protein
MRSTAQRAEGDYCDNTRLYCDETNYPVSYRYWTSISRKKVVAPTGANEIMSGISCSGSYCDNVSIECSGISSTRYNCQWIGPFSEEQGFAYFGGQYANGMWCTGDYCDNHYYLVCNFG